MIRMQVENSSVCNAKCTFCPYPTSGLPKAIMDMDLFRKIVDETVDIPHFTEFNIVGLGEPTLDRFLVDRVWYVHQKLPTIRIVIFSNGVALTNKLFDSLKEAGLSTLIVSLNAVRAEQHEKIMGLKGKFEQVCANIDYAIANREHVEVEVHAVCSEPDFPLSDGPAFYSRWGHRAHTGYGQLVGEMNWAGDNRTIAPFKPNEGCIRALGGVYIRQDGVLTACCFDPTGRLPFGNVKTQTIREIYNSEKYLKFREAHNENRADEYEICKGCTRV